MRRLALLCVLAAAVGCGEKQEPAAPSRAPAVTGTLALERAPAGAPDAGTGAGHRAPGYAATTSRSAYSFTGTLKPARSTVALAARPRRGSAQVRMGDGGRFRVLVRGLRRGTSVLTLVARAAGLKPWRAEVAIKRR